MATTDTDTITTPITNPSHHSPSNSQGSSTNPPPLSPLVSLSLDFHFHALRFVFWFSQSLLGFQIAQKEEIPEPPGDKQQEEDTAMDSGTSAQLQLDNKPQIHDGFQYVSLLLSPFISDFAFFFSWNDFSSGFVLLFFCKYVILCLKWKRFGVSIMLFEMLFKFVCLKLYGLV